MRTISHSNLVLASAFASALAAAPFVLAGAVPTPRAWAGPAAPAVGSGTVFDPDAPVSHLGGDRYAFAGADWQVRGGVVFALRPGAKPLAGAKSLGGRSWLLPTANARDAVEAARALARMPASAGIENVFPDVVMPKVVQAAPFDDPEYGGQWYLETLGMEALYALSEGDPAVRVAVIDSGIDIRHPDLASAVDAPFDAFADDADPSPEPGEGCDGGAGLCDIHGTAVSGVVLARAHNGTGIVGLCPRCTLIPIRLLGEGAGAMSADIAAFEHAIAEDAAVINNSWGYTRAVAAPAPLAAVIARAQTEPRDGKGALVVFAAGNDDRVLRDDELTGLPGVLCVSATDSYGAPTNYTNSGSSVDLAAPSATVSIAPDGGITETFGGTSAAAPVVSGLAAWALSIRPDLSAAALAAVLMDTAAPNPLVTRDDAGHHDVYGYGVIDPGALLAALTEPAPTDDPARADTGGPAPDAAASKGAAAGCSAHGGTPTAWVWLAFSAVMWVPLRRPGGPRAVAGS